MTTYSHRFDTPLGEMMLVGDGEALTGLYMGLDHRYAPQAQRDWVRDASVFADAQSQLEQYFAGERRDFDLPLAPAGTDFQKRVWDALTKIPYGETRSYGQQATALGKLDAVRAVAAANGRNPISIIVPCHRVIGADGSLTGYGGGLDRKRYLLDLERGAVPLPLGSAA